MTFHPQKFTRLCALLLLTATLGIATPTATRAAQDTEVSQDVQDADAMQDASNPQNEGISTGFDSIWTGSNIPTQAPTGLEQVMLSDDKILVVLGVVLIIWFGIIALLLRNDRRIGQLEKELENHRSDF